jgi:AcrR family transcriptional regulator
MMNDTADVSVTAAPNGGPEREGLGWSSAHGLAERGGRAHADTRSDARSRGDTRARIQQVAVELFTEHGYEGTSLREIAERLDVTKAALYYHFKSKEDIVRSLVEDYFGQIDALIAWGKSQPRTDEVRREILCRYVSIVAEGDRAFRLLHQNQAAVNTMASAKSRGELFRERMHSLVELLTEPDAPLPERVRAAMTLGGISVGWMFFADQVSNRREFSDLVSSLACDFAKVTG